MPKLPLPDVAPHDDAPPYDDEIDLFDLFAILWDGKGLIAAFVLVFALFGSGYLLMKEPVYESKLNYAPDTLPPFYESGRVALDFQKMFYSQSRFDHWKNVNKTSLIAFEDFSKIVIEDGFTLTKDENKQRAILTSGKNGEAFILVRSNQLPLLDEFFHYANYINQLLQDSYALRAMAELKLIETRAKDLVAVDNAIIQNILVIDRYLAAIETGANVFAINRPTMPKKTEPKSVVILALSVVFGGMIGVFAVLLRNAFRKRKAQTPIS